MNNINLRPARGVDRQKLEIFKVHLSALLEMFTQAQLGERMGVKSSNMNSYIRGTLPITKGFLRRFYSAWQDSIEERTYLQVVTPTYQNTKAGPTLHDIMDALAKMDAKLSQIAELFPELQSNSEY